MAVSMESGSEVMLDRSTELRLPTGQGVEHIWAMIFEYLKDPSDFYHLLLASPKYFEPFLQDRKCSLLFPLVLQVLERRDYIPKKTTLKCRLVSKASKFCIDKCILDGNPCFENVDDVYHGSFDQGHDSRHCWKMGEMVVQTYEKAVRNGRFTPFLDGFLPFQLSTDRQSSILSNFRHLLAIYGNQIRHFLCTVHLPRVNMYELLQEFLSQMPNLRTLQVRSSELREFDPQDLPELSHLRVLKLVACSEFTQVFRILLSRYGPQVEMLQLDCCSASHLDTDVIHLCGNLKHLALPLMSCDEGVRRFLNPALNWPTSLDTLSIQLILRESIEGDSNSLFVALDRCFGRSRTLRNLHIRVCGVVVSRGGPNICFPSTARLSLPSLKILRLTAFADCSICIDFILGMSETLEELTLEIQRRREKGRSLETKEHPIERIQCLEHLERMYDSNVWDLMPKLEHITIRCKQFPIQSPVPLPIRTYRYKRTCLSK